MASAAMPWWQREAGVVAAAARVHAAEAAERGRVGGGGGASGLAGEAVAGGGERGILAA